MGVVFLLYLAVLLVFDHPVRVAADTLAETPLKALATGLMVLLLLGPIVLLLAASVIGLLVVPVVLCMVFVGRADRQDRRRAGGWAAAWCPKGEHSRLLLARSFAIGSVLLILTYMVPILGGVVWALAGATGLGAASAGVRVGLSQGEPAAAPAGDAGAASGAAAVRWPPSEGTLGPAAAFTAIPAGETLGGVRSRAPVGRAHAASPSLLHRAGGGVRAGSHPGGHRDRLAGSP